MWFGFKHVVNVQAQIEKEHWGIEEPWKYLGFVVQDSVVCKISLNLFGFEHIFKNLQAFPKVLNPSREARHIHEAGG